MRLSIRNSVMAVLAVGVAALVLAACGGNDDGGDATAADAGSGSGVVSVRTVDGTDVLADAQGHTLYSADVEKGGQIKCTGMCTSFWEPTTASAKDAKAASTQLELNLGTVQRPDGGRQLTLEGIPLYSFTEEGAGQLDGDGFVDDFNGTHFVWTVAATDAGSPASSAPSTSSPY